MEAEKGMCKIIEDIVERESKQARQIGFELGEKQAQNDTACRMIEEETFTAEQIAKISGLPLDEVEELIKKRSA